jgi:hypothetical protein
MPSSMERKTIIVVGLGMVGLSFIEKILEYDTDKHYDIVTFSEESLGKASSIITQALLIESNIFTFFFLAPSCLQSSRSNTVL